jgi:cysteine-rich repeat protein
MALATPRHHTRVSAQGGVGVGPDQRHDDLGRDLPSCGDGFVNANDEDCDDTNLEPFDGCNNASSANGVVGSYNVGAGPDWNSNPPTYTCREACALVFGGAADDYRCSTNDVNMTQTSITPAGVTRSTVPTRNPTISRSTPSTTAEDSAARTRPTSSTTATTRSTTAGSSGRRSGRGVEVRPRDSDGRGRAGRR